jgi:hypothetical protein
MEVSGQQVPAALPPKKKLPGTHCVADRVDTRTGLDAVSREKSLSLAGNRNPGVQPIARRYTG